MHDQHAFHSRFLQLSEPTDLGEQCRARLYRITLYLFLSSTKPRLTKIAEHMSDSNDVVASATILLQQARLRLYRNRDALGRPHRTISGSRHFASQATKMLRTS